MSNYQPRRPATGQNYDMYDDQSYLHDHPGDSSSQSHQARKDFERSPPRGPAGDRTYQNARQEQGRGDRQDHYRNDRYDRSPKREGRGRYLDRDREGYQSPNDRSRSRSPYYGGPPNRNVIIEGLPIDMTQEDVGRPIPSLLRPCDIPPASRFFECSSSRYTFILQELQHNLGLEGLEEVRLIRDKRTGQSRQFAFAQFSGIPDARRFLDQYYPSVPLYGLSNARTEQSKARIAYSREKEDKDRPGKGEDDWKCDVCYLSNFSHRVYCFRCNAPRMRPTANGIVVAQNNMSSYSGFATTGDSDVSPDGTSSQFLLLRGLEPGVNEELLAKGVSKLYKTKATSPPVELQAGKKLKVTSTSNDSSLGAKDGSLRRVLLIRSRDSGESWRYGFAEFNSVEDAQAAMAKYNASEKFTISSKPVLVSYIHAGVFVPVLQAINEESDKFTFSPLSSSAVKLMYWDEGAYASELALAVAEKVPSDKIKRGKHDRLAVIAAAEGLIGPGKDGEPKAKKRKVDKENKIVAPHLQFWTSQHAELHGIPAKVAEDNLIDPSVVTTSTPQNIAQIAEAAPSQTFADLNRKCCLLCSRQFKTEAEVNKHERMSKLHSDNLKNEDLVSKAFAKLSKSSDANTEASAYRDRARERRQAFNQPKQPVAQHNRVSKNAKASSPDLDQDQSVPAQSKGAALLGKMGWTAGKGLGAQGTGRTDAIVTELYTQGVGLGAEGGKVGDATEEAQRQTKGSYVDFLNKTKEKAKERFESLG